jgi:hypothetical protein
MSTNDFIVCSAIGFAMVLLTWFWFGSQSI